MKGFQNQFTTIKGVSDVRRLPRLGKIYLGVKVLNKKFNKEKCKCKKPGDPGCFVCTHPKEVDYFVIPEKLAKVKAFYGDEPKVLDIMVPVNNMEVVFPQAYKWYGKSKGVKCIGNGIIANRKTENDYEEIKCPCDNLKTKENPKGSCSRVAHFMFALHDVDKMGGVYQIDTGSIHSIIDIQSGLEYAAELYYAATGQRRFNMLPLKLKRVERETHGSGRKETHYTMMVELNMSVDELNEAGKNPMFIQGGKSQFLLEPPKELESTEIIYDDDESKEIPSDYKPVTAEEQEKTNAAKTENSDKKESTPKRKGNLKDPLKMNRKDLMAYLREEKGKRYTTIAYNTIKKELFGTTGVSKITLKMFQNLYEKLELGAVDEAQKG